MSKVKDTIARIAGIALSFVTIAVGALSVNSACIIWFHQPEVPQGMDKFKRH